MGIKEYKTSKKISEEGHAMESAFSRFRVWGLKRQVGMRISAGSRTRAFVEDESKKTAHHVEYAE
jgi:hypothetical protein